MRKVIIRSQRSAPRRHLRREINWKKIVYALLVTILALTIVIMVWGLSHLMKITEVRCYGEFRRPCFTIENDFVNGYINTNSILTLYTIRKDLVSKFEYLESAKLSLDWKRELTIELKRKKPVAMITTPELASNNRFFTVTDEGIVMDEVSQSSSPIFISESINTSQGNQLGLNESWTIKLLNLLTSDGSSIIAKSKNEILILEVTKNSKKISLLITPLDKEIVEIGQWIIALASDPQIVSGSEVDLRFERPVLIKK